jgi:hypothetical protein
VFRLFSVRKSFEEDEVFVERKSQVQPIVEQSQPSDVAVKPPILADQSHNDVDVVKASPEVEVKADATELASVPDQPEPTVAEEATDAAENPVLHLGYLNAANVQQILADRGGDGVQTADPPGPRYVESSDSEQEGEPPASVSASGGVELAPAASDDADIGAGISSPSHVASPTACETTDGSSAGVAKSKEADETQTVQKPTNGNADIKATPRLRPSTFAAATDYEQKTQPGGRVSTGGSFQVNGRDAASADVDLVNTRESSRSATGPVRPVLRRSRLSKVETTDKPPAVELTIDASFEPAVVADLRHSGLEADGRSAFEELREYLTKTGSSGGDHPLPVAAARVSTHPGHAIDNLRFFLRSTQQA